MNFNLFLPGGRHIFADKVGAKRQLPADCGRSAPPAGCRLAAHVKDRFDGGPHGAAGVNDIVDQQHRPVVQIGADVGRADAGRLAEQAEIVLGKR